MAKFVIIILLFISLNHDVFGAYNNELGLIIYWVETSLFMYTLLRK